MGLGRYNGAIKCYDQSIKLNPKYDLAWYGRGLILALLGNNDEAVKSFDRALEINPMDGIYGHSELMHLTF